MSEGYFKMNYRIFWNDIDEVPEKSEKDYLRRVKDQEEKEEKERQDYLRLKAKYEKTEKPSLAKPAEWQKCGVGVDLYAEQVHKTISKGKK